MNKRAMTTAVNGIYLLGILLATPVFAQSQSMSDLIFSKFKGLMPTPVPVTNTDPNSLPTAIHAPCLEPQEMQSPRLDLQSCTYFFQKDFNTASNGTLAGISQGQISTLSTSNAVNFKQLIDNYFGDQLRCFYQGYLLYPAQAKDNPALLLIQNNSRNPVKPGAPIPPSSPDFCKQGLPVPGAPATVCSIADGEGSISSSQGNVKVTPNHIKQDCGNPDNQDQKYENNQIRGLWVQAVKYYEQQVMNEITGSSHALKIDPGCQYMAADYVKLNSEAHQISNSLVSGISTIPSQVYTGGVNFCDGEGNASSNNNSNTSSQSLASEIPKQAACNLAISRDNRVALFMNIAKCEVWTRVSNFQANYSAQNANQVNAMIQDCTNQAIQVGNEVGERVGHHKMSHSAGQEAGEAAGQQAFKDCYRPKIQNFFNSFSDPNGSLPGKSIPTPGSPQSKNEELKGQPKSTYLAQLQTSSFSAFFLFGTIRTRKKKKKAVKSTENGVSAKKVFIFVLINLILLYSLSYFGWGCGCGGGGGNTNAPTMVSICTQTDPVDVSTLNPPPQKVQDCCDPSKQYQTMLPDVASNPQKCMECNSYCAPNAATAAAAALSAGQAEAGNMAAKGLQSIPQGTTPTGIPSPYVANQNAALAGDNGAGQSALSGKSTSGLGNTGLPRSGGGGSGGGIGNSGKGQGGYASSNGLTPPAPISSPSGAALLGDSGGTYSSGGSGSTGSSRTGFGYDRSTAGISGSGAANTMTFGETAESSNSLQGSDDPADYFTRIGLDKSIFKIVHDRYQAKSRAWVRSSFK